MEGIRAVENGGRVYDRPHRGLRDPAPFEVLVALEGDLKDEALRV
jgi:hypothetical protein